MTKRTPLEVETRRRLWYSIGLLDVQASFDRGSRPLLCSADFHILPQYDLAELSLEPAQGSSGRYCQMTCRAMVCSLRLAEIGASAAFGHGVDGPVTAWRRQVDVLSDFESHCHELAESCAVDATPLEQFTVSVAQECLICMRLAMRRPLCKQPRGFEAIPDDDFDVLTIATEVLEQSLLKTTIMDFSRWRWFAWPKWFALAVVLAELCGPRGGSMSERGWIAAQESYEQNKTLVADAASGQLWRPIARLMRRAKAIRATTTAGDNEAKSPVLHETHGLDHETPPSLDALMTDVKVISSDSVVDIGNDGGLEQTEAMSWINWELFVDDMSHEDFLFDLDSIDVKAG